MRRSSHPIPSHPISSVPSIPWILEDVLLLKLDVGDGAWGGSSPPIGTSCPVLSCLALPYFALPARRRWWPFLVVGPGLHPAFLAVKPSFLPVPQCTRSSTAQYRYCIMYFLWKVRSNRPAHCSIAVAVLARKCLASGSRHALARKELRDTLTSEEGSGEIIQPLMA